MMDGDLVNKPTVEEALLEYERLLNQNGYRRFHLRALDDYTLEFIEIKPLIQKKLFGPLTMDQALVWFKRHVKVTVDV